MATPTYDLIDSVTLSATASSVSFTSIGSSYQDLILIAQHSAATNSYLGIRFNDDSSTSYPFSFMAGTGSSTSAGNWTSYDRLLINASYTNAQDNLFSMQIMDYAVTDKQKTMLIRQDNYGSNPHTDLTCATWANTSAITKIQIWPNYTFGTGNFTVNSAFYLYGVTA